MTLISMRVLRVALLVAAATTPLAAQRGRRAQQLPPVDTAKAAREEDRYQPRAEDARRFRARLPGTGASRRARGDSGSGGLERHLRQPARDESHAAHGAASDEGRGARRPAWRSRGERADDDGGPVAHQDRGRPAGLAAAAGAAAGEPDPAQVVHLPPQARERGDARSGADEPAHRHDRAQARRASPRRTCSARESLVCRGPLESGAAVEAEGAAEVVVGVAASPARCRT